MDKTAYARSCYMLKAGIIPPKCMANESWTVRECGRLNEYQARLRPSPNQTHAKGAPEDQKAGDDPLLSPKNPPALIAEKIFRHQLD